MECRLCPRNCLTDRKQKVGFCSIDDKIYLAKAYLHKFEEPCISGTNGSGTVFFSGCNMKCCFCQNHCISAEMKGKEVSVQRLAEIFCELESKGAHNINLVTGTMYADKIITAAKQAEINIPIVYNCGGYENVSTVRALGEVVDIFMPDIKFYSSELSDRYCKAVDYFEKAISALDEMIAIAGNPVIDDDGIMQSGVIVRHLVMPSCYKDSLKILEILYERYGTDKFLLSLMSQYVPNGNAKDHPEINRRLTTFEYEKVIDVASEYGFQGFMQDRSSAIGEYIPDFDFEGV